MTAEIKKLSEALARILGLKKDGETVEADRQLQEFLETEFGLTYKDLAQMDEPVFIGFLKQAQFSAEKLEVLSQLIYSLFNPNERDEENQVLALKLKLIYGILVTEHRIINMVNLDRENLVKKYLSTSF